MNENQGQSFFVEYVKKWFKTIIAKVVEKINGKTEDPSYLFKSMLTPELSTDLKWDSSSLNKSIVAADVVSMDSPLPLKKRDSYGTASGEIPKIGMKMFKSEKLISDVLVLQARGATEVQIAQKIFDDVPRVITGVYERLEYMFLKALSTGVMLVESNENVGTAVRAVFGYKSENTFGVISPWSAQNFKPISDIERVISSAKDKGVSLLSVFMDKSTYEQLRNSDEAKALFATSIGNYTGNNVITPLAAQFDALMSANYHIKINVVDRSVRYEKNGQQTSVNPFASNTVIFLPSEKVGRLVYGILAEKVKPVAGVEYEDADEYILVSKYSKNDPLREFTSSQSLALPVIDGVDGIFILNTQEAQEVGANETEDEVITIWGTELLKADVIAALKDLGVKTAYNISDAKLIEKINGLSDEQEEQLKEALNISE
jgi:hypothetical protein